MVPSEANETGQESGTWEATGGGGGLPLVAGPGLGCGVPAASCACTGDTAAQSIGAAAAAAQPPPLPGTAAAAPSAAKATQPSPSWGCWGSPGVPRKGQWESQGVRVCLTPHQPHPQLRPKPTSFSCSLRSL